MRRVEAREDLARPVTITRPDGTTLTQTADEFRAERDMVQCGWCFSWDKRENFSKQDDRGRQRHQCVFVSVAGLVRGGSWQSGVDAWYSTRPVRRRQPGDDAPEAVEE